MIKSVWLEKHITHSLRTPDNILYYTHKNMAEHLSVREHDIVLFEPDGETGVAIHITRENGVLPDAGDITALQNSFGEARKAEDHQLVNTADGLMIPLRTDGTAVFGVVFVPLKNDTGFAENDWKFIQAFADCLYSEAMVGIIHSVCPEILQVRGLEVSYEKSVKIIKNIDFDVCTNELTVIFGSSGCGKTTTANAIGGMLKPSGGTILWNGKDVAQMNYNERTAYRRDAIGFVFQHYNLISDLSAKENVNIAGSLVKDPMTAEEALSMVGLSEKADRYSGKMSGGEQQRVCIARAIAKRPQILLCDEPTGALDPENSIRVMKILQDLVKEQHIAVVLITHNLAFSVLSDHTIVMSAGRIIEDTRQPFPLSADKLKLL